MFLKEHTLGWDEIFGERAEERGMMSVAVGCESARGDAGDKD